MDTQPALDIYNGYQLHEQSTMRILVYEYLTGGGINGSPPTSLVLEGELMVSALVRDLLNIPEVTVTLLRDARLSEFPHRNQRLKLVRLQADERPEACIQRLLGDMDAVWPIAPETKGCLESVCRLIEAHGKLLLTTPAKGVALAASKGKTLETLAQQGIPIVPTRPLESVGQEAEWDYPWVYKIDDGAGCEDTIIIRGPEDRSDFERISRQGVWIAQPLLEGDVLSLSGLFHQGAGRLLCCNRQKIRQTPEGFTLNGMTVNAQPDPEGYFGSLLSQIAQAIPALWGLAGVDLIFGREGPKVLEVNPRLTSAYPGIEPATGWNPAALVLELARHHRLPSLPKTSTGMPVELDWCLPS